MLLPAKLSHWLLYYILLHYFCSFWILSALDWLNPGEWTWWLDCKFRLVSHQCRQCCKHRYKAKPWKWISCPQCVHSGKNCLSRLGTKMGMKYTDPDMKVPMITDQINQNLRIPSLPFEMTTSVLACVYMGGCLCMCVQVCLHVYAHVCV